MGRNELRALRQLLNDDRDDWDELVASYLALRKAIVTNKPLTQKDRDRVAEYLRKAGWQATASQITVPPPTVSLAEAGTMIRELIAREFP